MGNFYQYSAPRINPLLGPGRKTELDFVHKKNIIAKRSIFDTLLADSMWGLGSAPLNNFALYHLPFIFPSNSEHLVVKGLQYEGLEDHISTSHFSIHFSLIASKSLTFITISVQIYVQNL